MFRCGSAVGTRRLFRLLRTPLAATAPSAAAVAAVLAAAAAARVRSHAHRRGRARASARWRHLATDRRRARGIRRFRVQRSPRAGLRLYPTGPTLCPPGVGTPGCGCPAGTWHRQVEIQSLRNVATVILSAVK
nr:uncharacterized protein LOC106824584 [Equus asinus]